MAADCFCRIAAVLLFILVVLLILVCACVQARGGGPVRGGAPDCADAQGGCSCVGGDDSGPYGDNDYENTGFSSAWGGARPPDFAVREPLYSHIVAGKVDVIARLNRGPFKDIKEGDTVTIRRSRAPDDKTEYDGPRRITATITSRLEKPSAEELIEAVGVKKMYPRAIAKDTAEGVAAFRGTFHTAAHEAEHGTVAFGIKRTASE